MLSLVYAFMGLVGQPWANVEPRFDPYGEVIRGFDTKVDTDAELMVKRVFRDSGESWMYKMVTADKTDQILIEFVHPTSMQGTKALFDQTRFRQLVPGSSMMAEGESPFLFEPSNHERYGLIKANYTATYEETDRIAGRAAYQIYLKPKNPDVYYRRLWIDKYARFLLRHDVWEPGDDPDTIFRVLSYRKRDSSGGLSLPAPDGVWVSSKSMPKVVTDPGVASTLTGFSLPRVDKPPFGLQEQVRQVFPTDAQLRPLRIRLTDGIAQIHVWMWKASGRGSSSALEIFGQEMKPMAQDGNGIGVSVEGDFPEDARQKIAETYLKSVRTLERSS